MITSSSESNSITLRFPGQDDAITATELMLQIGVGVRCQDTVISATREAIAPFGVLGKPKIIDDKTLPSKVSWPT